MGRPVRPRGRPDRTGPSERALLLIGASHKTAPIEERERLLRRATYSLFRVRAGNPAPWDEVILLTTCNRIEAYCITASLRSAQQAACSALGLPPDSSRVYLLHGSDAVAHLLRVASGLDSLAQGEGQIAAQVRRAASERPASAKRGKDLANLFERSARLAPRIRDIAGLPEDGTSASHAAVRFIRQAVPTTRPIVILLGSGKMARLAAGGLQDLATVEILARKPGGRRVGTRTTRLGTFDARTLRTALLRADVVIAATSSPRPLVTSRLLRPVVKERRGRPLWLIDLGFPRNVASSCAHLPGVTCVDIDGLAPWGVRAIPPAALARAEAFIHVESERLIESLRPSIHADVASFRRAFEDVRQEEVARALARMPHLSSADREVVEKLTTRLMNRVLHVPTQRLRGLPAEVREQFLDDLAAGLKPSGVGTR